MKPQASEKSARKVAMNFVGIIGLGTEMARRVNENISKVQIQPLSVGLNKSTNGVIAPHVEGPKF